MLGWFYLVFLGALLLAVLILGTISVTNPKAIKEKKSRSLIWILVIIAIALIFLSLFMPLILPQVLQIAGNPVDKINELGDAIGGLMNPFIAISAVIVTGLAFYMQYQANQQIQYQFKIEQIESQFYEMLGLHKDNVNEIQISTEGNEKIIAKGRSAFSVYKEEFEMALKMLIVSGDELNTHSFHLLYHLFFEGVKYYPEKEMTTHFPLFIQRLELSQPYFIDQFDNEYWDLQEEYYLFYTRNEKHAFQGHAGDLGHYYRHLYQTVKYIVSQMKDGVISYDSAMKYLKILRAQLSNDEQVMLFYNWMAGLHNNGFGYKWESDENKFFTEFLMIHNLPYGYLFQNKFIDDHVQHLRDIPTVHRKSKLFERDK